MYNNIFSKLHVSFKWKILLPIAGVFGICSIILTLYINAEIESNYENSQQSNIDQQKKIIFSIIEETGRPIHRSVLMIELFIKQNRNKISFSNNKEMSILWESLKKDSLLNEIYGFDINSGKLLFDFKRKNTEKDELSKINKQQLFNDEYYENFVKCSKKCKLYFREKIKIDASLSIAVFASIHLKNLVSDFQNLSKTDMAILSSHKREGSNHKSLWLDNLSAYHEASSHFYATLVILNKIPVFNKDYYNGDYFLVNHKGKKWAIYLIPSQYEGIVFALLDDITTYAKSLRSAKYFAMGIIFLAYTTILFLLYMLLRSPLAHLRKIGYALPLLGQSDFIRLRSEIGQPNIHSEEQDELAIIHNTAYEVSLRLEHLESDLNFKAGELSDALHKASSQSNFLAGLLDHSQILVLALKSDLTISLANTKVYDYIFKIKGNLTGFNLRDIFEYKVYNALTNQLSNINSKTLSHEISLTNAKQEKKWIEWMFCKLPDENINDTHYLLLGVDITFRREAERKIRFYAEHDALTGLYNRRHFSNIFSDNLKKITPGNSLCLMSIDLDKFKTINDNFGHKIGDDFLISVSEVFKEYLPDSAIIGRMGGDEFAISINLQPTEVASDHAKNLIDKIGKISIAGLPGYSSAGASIGIALAPLHGHSLNELMTFADIAMYTAKYAPNVSVLTYSLNIHKKLHSVMDKRTFIRQLMTSNRICLAIQPIYHIENKEIVALECLTRVSLHPGEPEITTEILFEYAAECDLSADLDYYVFSLFSKHYPSLITLENAAFDSFDKNFSKHLHMAINFSGKSIVQPDFLEKILSTCATKNIDMSRLAFEVTETQDVKNIEAANKFLTSMRAQGAITVLDDFGDGFADFKCLSDFQFNWVKIDGYFVKNIINKKNDQIIVKSLIDAAKKLGLQVVIECVETEEVLSYLQQTSVDMVQGWLIGREVMVSDTE